MKQLLIVNSAKALNATNATPKDLSVLEKGAITFFELGATTALATKPTKNFGIALGRGNNSPAFVIPEVDINSLQVTVAEPTAGNVFTSTFTCPDTTNLEDNDYTVVIVKKNVVFNERNAWTTTIRTSGLSATDLAKKLVADITAKAQFGGLNIVASENNGEISIAGTVIGEDWEVKLADGLFNVSFNTKTPAKKNIGDTAYVQDLARQCAADKGFNSLAEDGKELYPGYPEDVETIAQTNIANDGYVIFNLHFGTIREGGKQLNERVWQYVHIAVPKNNESISTIRSILGQPVLVNEG